MIGDNDGGNDGVGGSFERPHLPPESHRETKDHSPFSLNGMIMVIKYELLKEKMDQRGTKVKMEFEGGKVASLLFVTSKYFKRRQKDR